MMGGMIIIRVLAAMAGANLVQHGVKLFKDTDFWGNCWLGWWAYWLIFFALFAINPPIDKTK